jgi:CubicO group peptidase (beta-lactamase class C family)
MDAPKSGPRRRRGKIHLTDPVSKFLPAFKGQQVSVARADAEFARVTYITVPADREATVQDLLRHTAGLADGEITVMRRSRPPTAPPACTCRACATTIRAT